VKCFVVLPCYNEEQNIESLIPHIDKTLRDYIPYQIIAINDGSDDDTGRLLKHLSKQHPIEVLEHPKNKGLAATLQTGLSAAVQHSSNGDLIITMDSDNTHDPMYILDMLKVATEADMVVGSRYVQNGKQMNVPPHRMVLSRMINYIIRKIANLSVMDATSGYRCFKASSLKKLEKNMGKRFMESKGFEASLEILLKMFWCNSTIKEVPITLDYNKKEGWSKMKLLPTIKRYVILLTKIKDWRNELEANS